MLTTRKLISWNRASIMLTTVCLLVCVSAPQLLGQTVPHYKVDPLWPKDLPNDWMIGPGSGVAVDKDDHIWILHRPRLLSGNDLGLAVKPPAYECCLPAPSLVEFDAQGNVLKSWGGPEYVPHWPLLEYGLFADKDGDFWIGGSYKSGEALQRVIPRPKDVSGDRQVLKFSSDGKLLLEIGHPSDAATNNQDTSILGGPAGIFVDESAHEVYIADGFQNRRVVVYDSMTGTFKRGWGAYGMPLTEISNDESSARAADAPPAKQFRGDVLGIAVSADGLVYVGDRGDDRIQVFTRAGKFVKEFLVHPETLGSGSVWGIILSRDPKQKYLYVSDGENGKIWFLNRDDGKEVGSVGHKGKFPGDLDGVQAMALDSHSNLYVIEHAVQTHRIQRFVIVK